MIGAGVGTGGAARARAALLCVALTAACGDEPPAPASPALPEPPPLSAVVDAAIAELEGRLASGDAPAPPSADAETRARVAGLLDTLRTTRGSLRGAAVAEFGELGDVALRPLEELLREARVDADVGAAAVDAAEAVAAVGTPRAAELLAEFVEDGLSVPREGAEATTWLRDQCAWRLGEMEQDVVVPRLALCLRYLRSEADYRTGVWIASALAAHGNYSGVHVLREILASGFPEALRAEAWDVAQRLVAGAGAADLADLEARWDEARSAPAEPSDALMLAVWRRVAHFRDFQLRDVDDARYALSNLGPWAAAILGAALSDEHLHVRVHSAQALERMGARGAGAVLAVRRALDDPGLGPQAAATLAAIDPVGAPPALAALAAPGRRLELRAAALRALAALARPETPALQDLVAPQVGPEAPLELRSLAAEVTVRSAPLAGTLAAARLVTESAASGRVDPTGARHSLAVWLRRLQDAGSADAGAFLADWEAPPVPGEGLERFTRLAAVFDRLLPRDLRSRTPEDR